MSGFLPYYEGVLLSAARESALAVSFVFKITEPQGKCRIPFYFAPGAGADVLFPGIPQLNLRQHIFFAGSPDTLPEIQAAAAAERSDIFRGTSVHVPAGISPLPRLRRALQVTAHSLSVRLLTALHFRNSAGALWLDMLCRQRPGTPLRLYPAQKSFSGYSRSSFFTDSGELRTRRLVFITEETGIIPILSVFRHLVPRAAGFQNNDAESRILVLWEAESRDTLLYSRELHRLARDIPRTAVVPSLLHDPLWTNEKGELTAEKLERLVPAFFGAQPDSFVWESALYRISGSSAFKRRIQKNLNQLEVPRSFILNI